MPLMNKVLRHPRLRKGKAGEHPDGVKRDEAADLGLGGDQQHDGCGRQRHDAVGKDQPMATLLELSGEKAVGRGEARQAGEVGEARIGGQDQDEGRARLQCEKQYVTQRCCSVDVLADLGDDRRCAFFKRGDVHGAGQDGQPEEHDAQG